MSFLRWLPTGAAGVAGIALLVAYPTLPEVVPTHFNFAGEPDAWGEPWNALVLAGVWLLLAVGLAVLSRHPRIFNYPVPLTEENAQRLYREGERLMVWTGLACGLTLGAGVGSMLGWAAAPLLVAGLTAMFVAVVVGVIRMFQVS